MHFYVNKEHDLIRILFSSSSFFLHCTFGVVKYLLRSASFFSVIVAPGLGPLFLRVYTTVARDDDDDDDADDELPCLTCGGYGEY